ncbi:MAG TPA: NAD-dependent succinate-semialdehyde dehydrogenase [Gemmatimonadota bacterium]|nr:NAD-dependent succinate-semialdehyde dehydrogenase [Gemmatimonadota bacterium]
MGQRSIDPATGRTVAEYDEHDDREVDGVVAAAAAWFDTWRDRPFTERAEPLLAAADRLESEAGRWAELMATEMGKPLAQGRSEAEKCAWVCRYYAEHGADFLAPEPVETDASRSFVAFRPLGPILAVMPWNFPFWQVFRAAAPALMAGNTMLLKHASNVPGCARAIEQIFRDAGLPDGAFSTLLIGSDRVERLIADPAVRGVTLTGSTPAGRAVGAAAGEHLKKTVLELGGSDPYVILADADLERAVETCVTSRLINSGQSCIAAKRFIVVEQVREAFEATFVERMRTVTSGAPLDGDFDIGPLARTDLRDDLHDQVERSVAEGARLALGGERPDGPGAFYPPTVLADVGPGNPARLEELFGPVAAIIPVRDEDEALAVANETSFGLGAAVFTGDTERGIRIAAERLEAGACFVNAYVRSDPRLPFGGVKDSGIGRELSRFGIREFVNVKTVYAA